MLPGFSDGGASDGNGLDQTRPTRSVISMRLKPWADMQYAKAVTAQIIIMGPALKLSCPCRDGLH